MSILTPKLSDIALYLAVLADIPQRLADFARPFSDEQLAVAPAPKAWSPAEVLAHLRGCDEVWTQSMYAMLAEDTPHLPVLNPRQYAKAARYAALPFSASLQSYSLRRAELLRVLQDLPLARWNRAAVIGRHTHTVFSQARRLATHEQQHCAELEGRGV